MDDPARPFAALDLTPLDRWELHARVRTERGHRVFGAVLSPADDHAFYALWDAISGGDAGQTAWHAWRVRARAELGDGIARERWSGGEMGLAEEEFIDDLPWSEDLWLPAAGGATIVIEATISLNGPRGAWWQVARGGAVTITGDGAVRAPLAPIDPPAGAPFGPAPTIGTLAIPADEHDALVAWPPWRSEERSAPPRGVPARAWGWDVDGATGRAAWPVAFPGDDGWHASLVAWHDADGAQGQVYVPAPSAEVIESPRGWRGSIDVRGGGALYRIDPARGTVVRVIRDQATDAPT